MLKYLALLAILPMAACGSTDIDESHLFQVRDNSGEVSYYRVNVEADAHLSKVEYRAGLYDARKLNYLLNEVSLNLHEDDAPQRGGASSGDDQDGDAMANDTEAAKSGDDEEHDGVPSDPNRAKFAIVLSTRASEIEEALADIAEEEETTRLILGNLEGQKKGEILDDTIDLIALNNRKKSFESVGEETTDELQGTNAAERQAARDKVKRWLEEITRIREGEER